MTDKTIKAIIRHERAVQRVERLTHRIGVKLGHCQIEKQRCSDPHSESLVDEKGRTKSHLWHAFDHKEPSSCGYGRVGLCEEGINDALSSNGGYACRHCKRAWQLILRRKEARQELGNARRSIRAIGRSALAKEGEA